LEAFLEDKVFLFDNNLFIRIKFQNFEKKICNNMILIQFSYRLFMCCLKNSRDNYTNSTNIFNSQIFAQNHS